MNRDQIIEFVNSNNVDENTLVVFTINENGTQIMYNGRFEFNSNGSLALTNDILGIRVQRINGASDMPYVGGLTFENLINVTINA